MQSQHQLSIPDKIIATANTLVEEPAENVREQLIFLINELINTDFHALIQLLYRVDVDERKLKQIVAENGGVNPATIIADLIIKRELQKQESRKQFGSSQPPNHDDGW